ncbi:MAG: carbon-nitrogen hydrolase family protein [Acidobacteria bacterium]|nr:carbon-nitrogen hydrolase family protein [Acidobacteriota bacterium]
MPPSVVVVAAIQAAPIYMNLERSLARALDLIAEAAKRRAQLVVFPESWLPGYPAWLDVCRDVAVWDNQQMKRLYAQLHENSVVVPGKVTEALGEAAKRHNLTLVIGVQERVADGAGRGTLYNSVLTFGPDGELLNCHRKLVPTFNERLIWGQGDGSSLRSVETPIGRIGSLICWEHWMPLVRQKLHIDGEDIHVALWPSVKEMHQIASRQYAFEGRCFVVAAGGIMRYSDLPREFEPISSIQADDNEFILNGGSAVIGPDGQYVAGPSFGSEVIILARINLARIREESMTLDVTGHFNRPDLFDFRFKGASDLDQTGQVEIMSQTGLEFASSQSAEALRSTGTESISPLAPEAAPSLRVVSLNRDAGRTGIRNSGFDSSDVQQIENKA